jgi:hypothetical protein
MERSEIQEGGAFLPDSALLHPGCTYQKPRHSRLTSRRRCWRCYLLAPSCGRFCPLIRPAQGRRSGRCSALSRMRQSLPLMW